jgi:hypothetical protein
MKIANTNNKKAAIAAFLLHVKFVFCFLYSPSICPFASYSHDLPALSAKAGLTQPFSLPICPLTSYILHPFPICPCARYSLGWPAGISGSGSYLIHFTLILCHVLQMNTRMRA